ncbi:hypothetical protein D3C71_2032430 [compost metagenome]
MLWKTKPMRLRRSLTLTFGVWTSWPSTVIVPPEIGSSRLIVRIRVDLPEPDGPQMTTTSPLAMVSEIPSSAL